MDPFAPATIEETFESSRPGHPDAQQEAAAKHTCLLKDLRAHVTRRRAEKACQCCRLRKVRCNVLEHGVPCYNCKSDQVKCVVLDRRRIK
jgi:hypothetical protein